MAWTIGHCDQCRYRLQDRYGNSCYCIFKVRHRYFSLLRMKFVKTWRWICDECESQTTKQSKRNRSKSP